MPGRFVSQNIFIVLVQIQTEWFLKADTSQSMKHNPTMRC